MPDRNNQSQRPNRESNSAVSDAETHEQGLRKEQAEKNALATEVQELKKQLADTENRESVTQRSRRHRHKAPQIPDEDKRNLVKDIAHKFTYMSLLWLHQPSETFQLILDEEYDPVDRFQSEDGWLQGQLRDLLEVLPGHWHKEMKDELFINTFVSAMQQQRCNASTRVRPDAGAAIFKCTHEEFSNRADTFKELIGWSSESGSYKVLAPILFKNYEGKMDKWKIFRNPILMRTYAALLIGPSSIKKAKGDKNYVRNGSHHSVESLWGVRCVTPAVIAASAILARFSASADSSFQPTGAITQITYQKDYEFYLKYLSEGLRANNRAVIGIFEEWNKIFYSDIPELPKQTSPSSTGEDLDNVINDLYEDMEGEGDGDGGSGGGREPAESQEDNHSVDKVPGDTQMSVQRATSPVENMDENAPIGIRNCRPNQPSHSQVLFLMCRQSKSENGSLLKSPNPKRKIFLPRNRRRHSRPSPGVRVGDLISSKEQML
ncbi:hypothetical protein M422DRAFT_24811 [Sphaerobolus stellatus SS14]|nr:hypothetical protein M422DRAFT_24811 [Sphaerobolus stellatus SS14]